MYEIFARLLQKKGVRAADVARATGLSNGTFSDWKKGRSNPNVRSLKKIADYFGVSVDYLMGADGAGEGADGEEAEPEGGWYEREDTREAAQEILEDGELSLLFDAARDASPEDLRAVHSMLLALKRKERHEDD